MRWQFQALTSIKTRYLVTFGAQVLKTGMSLISGIMVARYFGPSHFGDYSFLLGTFAAILTFSDLSAASAFFTFIAKKRRSQRFYAFYLFWMLAQLGAILLLVFLLLPPGWRQSIWFNHGQAQLLLAFLAAFATQVIWTTACYVGESVRATVVVKVWDILLALVTVGTILLTVYFRVLTINLLFILTISQYLLASAALIWSLRGQVASGVAEEGETFLKVFHDFKDYCLPLLVYSWGGCLAVFSTNWLLQKYGGSVQQGYYQAADKFTIIIVMITTSMMQIFWKEISEAKEQGNMEKAGRLFNNITSGLFFVSMCISCLLVPYCREIIVFFLGRSYEPAFLVWSVLLFNPLFASLGQFIATFFFATGHTRAFRNIWLIKLSIFFPVTYLVVATPDAFIPGLGLGALGQALKTLGINILVIMLYLRFITRFYNWQYSYGRILYLPLLFLAFGFGARAAGVELASLVGFAGSIPVVFLTGMVVYLAVATLFLIKFHQLVGIDYQYLAWAMERGRRLFNPTRA